MSHPLVDGFYPDLSRADYDLETDRANASTLKVIYEKHPAAGRRAQLEYREPTEALAFGNAFHVACLEPDDFEAEFIQGLALPRRKAVDKAAHVAFAEENADKTILSESQWETCMAMRDSVAANPTAKRIIGDAYCVEASAFWTDPLTGAPCKMRTDMIGPAEQRACITDLKSTKSATPEQFMRDAANYNYPIQAAQYVSGMDVVAPLAEDEFGAPQSRDFIFLCVEKTEPFYVNIFELGPRSMAEGMYRYQQALKQWWTCMQANQWPAFPSGVHQAEIANWAMTHERDDVEF